MRTMTNATFIYEILDLKKHKHLTISFLTSLIQSSLADYVGLASVKVKGADDSSGFWNGAGTGRII
jgi:hypothetical protein